MKIRSLIFILAIFCLAPFSCTKDHSVEPIPLNNDIIVTVKKWYKDHKAAVSITYDAFWGKDDPYYHDKFRTAENEVSTRHLRMDFEMVTAWYDYPDNQLRQAQLAEMREKEIPAGVHFFGHGHHHIKYDDVSADSAYADFKRCFDLMTQWGLQPKAYAYPGNGGRLERTQKANKDAGFICARGATTNKNKFYLCSDTNTEPENWYYLTAIPASLGIEGHVHGHSEMESIFNTALNKNSWIILMYHNIGIENGYAYYPFADFLQDIDQIQSQDFWSGNMDDVALYIREKNNFSFDYDFLNRDNQKIAYKVRFNDDYDNKIYNQPLTLSLTLNSEGIFQNCSFDPPVSEVDTMQLQDNTVEFDIVPDEKEYILTFYK